MKQHILNSIIGAICKTKKMYEKRQLKSVIDSVIYSAVFNAKLYDAFNFIWFF